MAYMGMAAPGGGPFPRVTSAGPTTNYPHPSNYPSSFLLKLPILPPDKPTIPTPDGKIVNNHKSIPFSVPGRFLETSHVRTLMRSLGLYGPQNSSFYRAIPSSPPPDHAYPLRNPNPLDPLWPRSPAMSGRSASFHGSPTSDRAIKIRRPESHPDLPRSPADTIRAGGAPAQRLMKLLLNVTVQQSPGPVQVMMSPESTVADFVRAAVEAYVREGRRPLLATSDPKAFELHYSQYSLESLNPTEKLMNLGSRNFFLCSKATKNPTNKMTVQSSA
ncbi:hypothetical protein J5N97_029282 [Dioscorea zingiberensis]|uniref:DUF7054 domain-containing protein n=1 Tax=Dioscorea zingiberensis TaxID=325984 RepID=A0A9D5C0D9_9LILI|nr:hypothetical protein J5N97_029282 [Dioscorea zingiberensis]